MRRVVEPLLISCAAAAALFAVVPAWAVHGGEGMQWSDAPPTLPKGAKVAVLQGDPSKPGPFVMRLSARDGYKVPPHSHSQAENLTVISGTFMYGMGDKFDAKSLKPMKAGAFGSVPAGTTHYAMAKGPTVVQIHGEGPFDIKYANPEDDPQKMAEAKKQ